MADLTTLRLIKETVIVGGGAGPQGLQGPQGIQGIQGDPGVFVGPIPPLNTSLLWVDTS